jgi:hypothetical protein
LEADVDGLGTIGMDEIGRREWKFKVEWREAQKPGTTRAGASVQFGLPCSRSKAVN